MLATQATQELDQIQRTSRLGVRFWDLVYERYVNDGLLVTATAVDVPSLPRIALPNRAGGFGFRTLPGLRDSEFGAGDSPFWASHPVHREYLIRMTDTHERFLPISFRALAPHPDWFTPPGGNHPFPGPDRSIPLFRNPTWSKPAGTVAVRGDLWDLGANTPAAWAFVQIRLSTAIGSAVAQGLADPDGRFVAAFPQSHPMVREVRLSRGSDNGVSETPSWTLELAVFYRRLTGDRTPPEISQIFRHPQATVIDPPLLLGRGEAWNPESGVDLRLRSLNDHLGRVMILPA